MALLHPYMSRRPATPPADDAMDHRRLPGAHDADACVAASGAGKRLSMRRRSLSAAAARSLVHSASAAAKGSAPAAGGWPLLMLERRRRL
jgi:hypothetical protein